MANLQAAPPTTNQQRTNHSPITAAVPDFAKEDPRPRWWCSQPTCFASTTAARDLNRHYRLHHPALIVNNQVLAEEKRSWIHAKYLDTGFATDVEVAAEAAAAAAAAVGMAQAALAVVEVEVEEDEVHEEPIRTNLPPSTHQPFLTLRIPLAAADLAQQSGDESEEEEDDDDDEEDEEEDDEDEEDEEEEEEEGAAVAGEINTPPSPTWTSAQLFLRAAELRHHAWDLREDGAPRQRVAACEEEAEEWEVEGGRVRGEEEAGLREAWDFGPAVGQARRGGPGVLPKGECGA